jgi:hypothetical protein
MACFQDGGTPQECHDAGQIAHEDCVADCGG